MCKRFSEPIPDTNVQDETNNKEGSSDNSGVRPLEPINAHKDANDKEDSTDNSVRRPPEPINAHEDTNNKEDSTAIKQSAHLESILDLPEN